METPQGEIGQPSLLARIAAEDQAVMEQIQCDHKDIVLVMKQITETIVAGMDLCGGVPLPNGAPQWVARFNTHLVATLLAAYTLLLQVLDSVTKVWQRTGSKGAQVGLGPGR